MRFFKVTLPLTLAFVMAVLAIVSVFSPHPWSENFRQENTVWGRVISGVTMFIGAYSLLRMHYNKIRRQVKGWGYSGVLFVFFAIMVVNGAINLNEKGDRALGPLVPRPAHPHDVVTWVYEAVQRPASSTQYSLLGFFICSAAFRTFRAKSVEAGVLLVAALIVMLGQVPIAELIWKEIPVASQWLLDVPNMAVKRAILFGICLGSVGTSLRVMFGIERSYMGAD